MTPETPQRLSWRDPSGFVVRVNDRILRAVNPAAVALADQVLKCSWYQRLVGEGSVASAAWLEKPPEDLAGSGSYAWLEHRVLRVPCYPHEITALQLYDAAKLTLRIGREALADGWQLKDASAWNVLFERGRPVFCDFLSFESLEQSGMWRAYAQFCRHFIIPLLLHQRLGMQPSGIFLIHRDGVTPESARPMLRGLSAYTQPALETVTLPAALAGRGGAVSSTARPRLSHRNSALASDILRRTLTRLDKHVDSLRPDARRSRGAWSDYRDHRAHYRDEDLAAKREFVARMLDRASITTVLDLGCNAGEYSILAAELGKKVVAADRDHGALTQLYAQVRQRGLDATPLVLDVARPTPPVGWMNTEIPGFIERARGRFDCVMALGLLHHLLVTERAPLDMIRNLFGALAPAVLILEWVDPTDARFRQIARLDSCLYEHLDRRYFESVFGESYVLGASLALGGGTRVLYCWERRPLSQTPGSV